MRLNQRGGTLVIVLLVILLFSILGLSVMGNTVGENKRMVTTETNVQARYLAESGLTYFEKDFKNFIDQNVAVIPVNGYSDYLDTHFLNNSTDPNKNYHNGVIINSDGDQVKVTAEIVETGPVKKVTSDGRVNSKEKQIKVTGTATVDGMKETLTGYYSMVLLTNFENTKIQLADFTVDGVAYDFANSSLIDANIILLDLGLINPRGPDQNFYRVPDDSIIDVNALGPILNISIGDGDRFGTFEQKRVIATREGELLKLGVIRYKRFSLLAVDVLTLSEADDTNVLIDGGYRDFELLGIAHNGYKDIDFRKFAVMGNLMIQQDRNGWAGVSDNRNVRRKFSFVEGLFVNKSLVIGESEGGVGILGLRGNMYVMNDLKIKDINLKIGDGKENSPKDYISDIYVEGNVTISNTYLSLNNSDQNQFRVFSKGSITINNNFSPDKGDRISESEYTSFPGLYYAEDGITINTNNKPMTIKGTLLGKVTVDHPEKLTYIPDPRYLPNITLRSIDLSPKGRSMN